MKLATQLEKHAGKKRRKKGRRVEPYPIEKVKSGGGKKSKRKGATFEAQIAKLFAAYFGCAVRRTPGSGAWGTIGEFGPKGDLVFAIRKAPYHCELKKHEGWDVTDLVTGVRSAATTSTNSIEKWWQQTIRDCPKRKVPMLVFARNRMQLGKTETVGVPPLLMMYTSDLHKLWLLSLRKQDQHPSLVSGRLDIGTIEHIPRLVVKTDTVDERVILTLADFFRYVRPPRCSPRRKAWKHGVG